MSQRALLLLFSIFLAFARAAYEPTAPGEVLALRALYEAAGGATWAKNNWLIGDPCGAAPYYCGEGCGGWQGVLCWGPGGHVRKLELPNKLLQGTLPTELGLLTGLAALDLTLKAAARSHAAVGSGGVGLSGTLPSELGKLPFRSTDADASALILSGHRISGSLPASLATLPEDLVRCALPATLGCTPNVGMPVACATPTHGRLSNRQVGRARRSGGGSGGGGGGGVSRGVGGLNGRTAVESGRGGEVA